jgi:hypothetical protein
MKKSFTFTIALLFLAFSLSAQTNTIVYGNLGVENVNISIANTQYGTSTDTKGRYELPLYDRSKAVNLYYSCIGYQDTVVSLTPKQLQRDSINISFRMRKMSYDLQEVGVTAHSDFYRSPRGTNIADIAFADGRILVLENRAKTSSLRLLDLNGNEMGVTDFDSFYDELYIDAFGDFLLLGQDSCLQVCFDAAGKALPVSTFTKDLFHDKIRKIVFEFNDAYLLRNTAYEKRDYYVKEFHGQAQTYNYVLKSDTLKQRHFLYRFIDTVAVNVCQSYLNEIFAVYNSLVPEKENELALGVWNGNLLRLAVNYKVHKRIGWYCQVLATEYHTIALKFNDFIQLVDLENLEIVEFDKNFQLSGKRPLIVSGKNYFAHQFLTDEATGKVYGLFVQNGIHYLGLYDPAKGTVGMGQKASNSIYPKVFKVYGGYAYSVYFDNAQMLGKINRVKIL